MLLALSLAVLWVGQAFVVGAVKKKSVTQLVLGHWPPSQVSYFDPSNPNTGPNAPSLSPGGASGGTYNPGPQPIDPVTGLPPVSA